MENISSLIERYCKKKLVFACRLLPLGPVGEAQAHCIRLLIAQANAITKICKRAAILPAHGDKQPIIN